MGTSPNETRLTEALAAFRAHQTRGLSSAGQALVHLVETLTEEVQALRRDLQSLTAASREAGQAEVQMLRQRIVALDEEVQALRGELQRLQASTLPRSSSQPLSAPARPPEYWAENRPGQGMVSPRKEKPPARLTPRGAHGKGSVVELSGQAREETGTPLVSSRRNAVVWVVPLVAIVLLVIVAVVGLWILFWH